MTKPNPSFNYRSEIESAEGIFLKAFAPHVGKTVVSETIEDIAESIKKVLASNLKILPVSVQLHMNKIQFVLTPIVGDRLGNPFDLRWIDGEFEVDGQCVEITALEGEIYWSASTDLSDFLCEAEYIVPETIPGLVGAVKSSLESKLQTEAIYCLQADDHPEIQVRCIHATITQKPYQDNQWRLKCTFRAIAQDPS